MSSVATCKLNARYETALACPRVYQGRGTIDGWGNQAPGIRDRKDSKHLIPIRQRPLSCCGLDELDFQGFQDYYDTYKNDDEGFEGIVAKIIAAGMRQKDERVMIVGLPTHVNGGSMYNIDYYKKLRQTLIDFGFVELCKPYKNKNSGNTMVAMAGQMP